MRYTIARTNQFKQSLKRCRKRGLDMQRLKTVISLLAKDGSLPKEYRPHKLSGKYASLWECHIQPDWLLIWQQNDSELILILTDTGTHSDLF
ncbi:MAG: type II toxin-antitoxin system YafQ family toxin [Muribaculaceae bacterium]|nr:type II toxin-antitoxin system YafQ family toxin [Muribaculaceae bacterium]